MNRLRSIIVMFTAFASNLAYAGSVSSENTTKEDFRDKSRLFVTIEKSSTRYLPEICTVGISYQTVLNDKRFFQCYIVGGKAALVYDHHVGFNITDPDAVLLWNLGTKHFFSNDLTLNSKSRKYWEFGVSGAMIPECQGVTPTLPLPYVALGIDFNPSEAVVRRFQIELNSNYNIAEFGAALFSKREYSPVLNFTFGVGF